MANSDELIRRDLAVVWHPCTQMKDHERWPPVPVARAQGVWIEDLSGHRFIDGISSWWINTLGHSHPRLSEALRRQLERFQQVMLAGFTHEKAIETAERLRRAAPPGLKHVAFASDGSSAVEMALKMSFQYWQQTGHPGKTRFVSLDGAYHGETLGALSVGGLDLYRKVYEPLLIPVHRAPGPDCFRCPYGLQRRSCRAECLAPVESLLRRSSGEIAAVLIEPMVQGAAGMRIHSPHYLSGLRRLCDAHGVHLIADEIMTGFGRTGRMWGVDHAAIAPDLMCLSKGLTGGFLPMSVTMATEEIFRAFYDDYETFKALFHSHSHSGNALACAVAAEVLAIYEEEGILREIQPKIAHLADRLERLADHPHVGEVRQLGMIAAVELVQDRDTRADFPAAARIGPRIHQEALRRGALLRPLGSVVYFLPPLVISEAEMDQLVRVAEESIAAVLG